MVRCEDSIILHPENTYTPRSSKWTRTQHADVHWVRRLQQIVPLPRTKLPFKGVLTSWKHIEPIFWWSKYALKFNHWMIWFSCQQMLLEGGYTRPQRNGSHDLRSYYRSMPRVSQLLPINSSMLTTVEGLMALKKCWNIQQYWQYLANSTTICPRIQ